MDDVLEGEGRAAYGVSTRVTVALSGIPYAEDPRTAFEISTDEFGGDSDATQRLLRGSNRDGLDQILYISRLLATSNATIHTVAKSIVARLCKEFCIMQDFCTYLYRLGPFTQDNLAYNYFRNGRIDFSSVPAYGRSWSDWNHTPNREDAGPSNPKLPREKRILEVCHILKFPRLTVDAGAQISSAFGIAHMAVYCYLGLNSSLCAIMEDSTHVLETHRTFRQLDERHVLPGQSSLDHLEKLVYSKKPWEPNREMGSVSSINIPASYSDNTAAELTLSVVTLRWLDETLQAARNAISANFLNLKSLEIAYQDTTPCYDLQNRFSKALESIAGEAERELGRAEQLQSRLQGISAAEKGSQLQGAFETTKCELLDQTKLQYISLSYMQGFSVVTILLPGIFVSILLSTSIFVNTHPTTLWFTIAIPPTVVATASVVYGWRIPIAQERIRQEGFRKWFLGMFLKTRSSL